MRFARRKLLQLGVTAIAIIFVILSGQATPLASLFSMPTLQSARLRMPVRTTMAAGTQLDFGQF
jgi:hypothetical protein